MDRQELLVKIFLLEIQNVRLQKLFTSVTSTLNKGPKQDVLTRIKQIESSLVEQINIKQEKIKELYQNIKQMHQRNTQIQNKYQEEKKKSLYFQNLYHQEIKKFNQKQIQLDNTRLLKQEDKLQTITKEKQYYEQQFRKFKVQLREIKELKVNIQRSNTELRKKLIKYEQNSHSHNLLLDRMKNENMTLKEEKIKLEFEVKELQEKINNFKIIKMEYDQQIKHNMDQSEILQKQIAKKNKQIEQYHLKYQQYCQKINNLLLENKKIKQTLNEANRKLTVSEKKQKDNLKRQKSIVEKKCFQLEGQINKWQVMYKNVSKQHTKLLDEIIQQKDKNYQFNEQQKMKITKERDEALRQWDEILQEMKKQKFIILSLEQEIQVCRKYRSTLKISTNSSAQTDQQEKRHKQVQTYQTSQIIWKQREEKIKNTQFTHEGEYSQKSMKFQKEEDSNKSLINIDQQNRTLRKDRCPECSQQKKSSITYNINQQIQKVPHSAQKQKLRFSHNGYLSLRRGKQNLKSQESVLSIQKSLLWGEEKNDKSSGRMSRALSEKKVTGLNNLQQTRFQTQQESLGDKDALLQKMGKISSWRQVEAHSKVSNFKRSNRLLNYIPLNQSTRTRKQGLNDIIHRKCQYVLEK